MNAVKPIVFAILLGLASMAVAQDVATAVAKGGKRSGKATKVVAKDVLHGTETAAKDTEHASDKAAHVAGRDTEKAGKKTAHIGERAETGVKDAGKDIEKGAEKTADALK